MREKLSFDKERKLDGLGISVSAGKSAVAEYGVEIEARLWLEAVVGGSGSLVRIRLYGWLQCELALSIS